MKCKERDNKVAKALSGLEALKQKIIELRYGLGSSKPMGTSEIAALLTRTASPDIILQFATHHKDDVGTVSFSVADVETLEAEALRDLARPCRTDGIDTQIPDDSGASHLGGSHTEDQIFSSSLSSNSLEAEVEKKTHIRSRRSPARSTTLAVRPRSDRKSLKR